MVPHNGIILMKGIMSYKQAWRLWPSQPAGAHLMLCTGCAGRAGGGIFLYKGKITILGGFREVEGGPLDAALGASSLFAQSPQPTAAGRRLQLPGADAK